MDRPFLDANVLFSAAYNPTSALRALWRLTGTALLSCPFAVQEAEINLAQARRGQLPDLAALVSGVTLVPDPPVGMVMPAGVQLPKKDEPILLAAIDGQATHLLTGDLKHFGPYFGQSVAGVLILRPAVYVQSRQSAP